MVIIRYPNYILYYHKANLSPLTFNSLWSSDFIWQHRSMSTLAQVMACCLMAPSHYLNQRWLLINDVLWHLPESDFITQAAILCDEFGSYTIKITATSPGTNELKVSMNMDVDKRQNSHASWGRSLQDKLLEPFSITGSTWWGWHRDINSLIPGRF